jgi:hypothetical protein
MAETESKNEQEKPPSYLAVATETVGEVGGAMGVGFAATIGASQFMGHKKYIERLKNDIAYAKDSDDLFGEGWAKLHLEQIEEANKGGILNRLKRPLLFPFGLNRETIILGAVLVGTTYLSSKALQKPHTHTNQPESFVARREQEKQAGAEAAQSKG